MVVQEQILSEGWFFRNVDLFGYINVKFLSSAYVNYKQDLWCIIKCLILIGY